VTTENSSVKAVVHVERGEGSLPTTVIRETGTAQKVQVITEREVLPTETIIEYA
jgi:hypothetical protein